MAIFYKMKNSFHVIFKYKPERSGEGRMLLILGEEFHIAKKMANGIITNVIVM